MKTLISLTSSFRFATRQLLRALVPIAICLLAPAVVLGASGLAVSLPKTKANSAGMTMTVNSQWPEGRGYRPYRFQLSAPAWTAARTIQLELTIGMAPDSKQLVVSSDFEIPPGATKVNHVMSVPQFGAHQYVSLDVWADGVLLEGLSFENQLNAAGGVGAGMWDTELPAILFVNSGTPLNLQAFQFLGAGTNNPYNIRTNTGSFANASQVATFHEEAPTDLVDGWINYTSLDVLVLSLADAQSLATSRSKVWRSIVDWTRAGGNLCVYGAGDDWKGLASLNQLLNIAETSEEAATELRGWQAPANEFFGKVMLTGNGVASNPTTAYPLSPEEAAGVENATEVEMPDDAETENNAPDPKPNSKKKRRTKPKPPDRPPFVSRSLMLGRVTAMADTNPFPGKSLTWQWLFNSLGPENWKWRFRHGLSTDYDNPGFDRFLITDIGLPPIKTYRVLISLFVVVIGPLNYWWLWRKGRLHLLLFTVPVLAAIVTLGLIGYVFLGDGLESRLRSRSVTRLDQRNHEAASWARLSYYAGFAPSAGLTFSPDVATLPLEKTPNWYSAGGRSRYLNWTPQEHLVRGWLPSRTPTQFVTLRAYRDPSELAIDDTDPAAPLKVTNRLGTKIHQLVVCDSTGRLFHTDELAGNAGKDITALANEQDKKRALGHFAGALGFDSPDYPGAVETSTAVRWGIFPTARNIRSWRTQGDSQDTTNSLLEGELARVRALMFSEAFVPRSYFAIVDRPQSVEVGVDGMLEKQGLHVIVGSW